MTFREQTFRTVQDVASLGGAYRTRVGMERLELLHQAYERIGFEVANRNRQLTIGVSALTSEPEL
jgi:hypothetical protein